MFDTPNARWLAAGLSGGVTRANCVEIGKHTRETHGDMYTDEAASAFGTLLREVIRQEQLPAAATAPDALVVNPTAGSGSGAGQGAGSVAVPVGSGLWPKLTSPPHLLRTPFITRQCQQPTPTTSHAAVRLGVHTNLWYFGLVLAGAHNSRL